MIDHRSALELAATAIDFDLSPDERRELDAHLGECGACRAEAVALRADATALATLPVIEPPTWVRRAIGRRHGPQRVVLLIAAALLLATTVGVALAVGAALRDRIVPALVPSASPMTAPSPGGPSPAASVDLASPRIGPSASATAGPLPIPTATSFPSTSGAAWMGASPEGGTWVLTVHEGGTEADPTSVSVIGLLDASGRLRPGWPIALAGWRCGQDAPPRSLPVAADGSIRLVCAEDTLLEGPLRHVGFAFDATGRPLAGWPVELPNVDLTTSAVVVGDELRLVASEIASTEGQAAPEQAAAWWLVAVSANGDVQSGRRYEVADAAGNFDVRLAPNGMAYRLAFGGSADTIRTEITAFDRDGVRPGWPVTVDGIASQPAVGPDGALVVVRLTKPAVVSQVLFIAPTGGTAITASGNLPVDAIDDRTGAGAVLLSPIVAADGAAWVVGTFDSTKPAVARVTTGGAVSGPYAQTGLPLQPQGVCDGQDVGCGVWRTPPAVAADGTLFIPTSAVGEGGGVTSSSGGSLAAIGPDGTPATGWPVFLPDTMAGYWAVLPRADRTIAALAVVPTTDGNQWSFVMLGADGRSRASTVLIEP